MYPAVNDLWAPSPAQWIRFDCGLLHSLTSRLEPALDFMLCWHSGLLHRLVEKGILCASGFGHGWLPVGLSGGESNIARSSSVLDFLFMVVVSPGPVKPKHWPASYLSAQLSSTPESEAGAMEPFYRFRLGEAFTCGGMS